MLGKKPDARPKAPAERPSARQRRDQREQRRRERMFAKSARKGGIRERIIGCGFSGLIVGGIVFLIALIGGLVWHYGFDR